MGRMITYALLNSIKMLASIIWPSSDFASYFSLALLPLKLNAQTNMLAGSCACCIIETLLSFLNIYVHIYVCEIRNF